jgi:dolichol-phosphate mannosyltransferase
MNTIAIIPCYNVETTVKEVAEIASRYVDQVIAIDDGSTDRTLEMLRLTSATIFIQPSNQGKGAAIRKGLESLEQPYPTVVLLDSDGQHDPLEIPKLLETFEREHLDLLIGSREMRLGKVPFIRWLANRLSNGLMSFRCHQNIHDAQSGYRILSPTFLDTIKLNSERYEIETEMLTKAADAHLKIGFSPIRTIYAEGHGHLKSLPLKQVWRNIMAMMK